MEVQLHGPEAADTPERRQAFDERENIRERKIGPTWDSTTAPPNASARTLGNAVARIVSKSSNEEPFGFGTGFLVAKQLLLTNHHVFPSAEDASGKFANFGYEETKSGVQKGILFPLDPDAFYVSDQALDFALVAIKNEGVSGERLDALNLGAVRMIGSSGKILVGQPACIIQHPDGGPKEYAWTENEVLDVLPTGYLHYKTDTAPGSSGSPVFNKSMELVALHHAGVPAMNAAGRILKKDGRVWNRTDSPDLINWVANEGIRVSSIVKFLQRTAAAEPSDLLSGLLESTVDPLGRAGRDTLALIPVPRPLSTGVRQEQPSANTFNFSGPVTINIYQGPSASVPASLPLPMFTEARQQFDPRYGNRPGYNSRFLPVEIPMPSVLSRAGELYTVGDYKQFRQTNSNVPALSTGSDANAPLELRYHHFSIVHNKKYRMAMFTAANADYTDQMRADTRSRKQFGSEYWVPDPRVPTEYQLLDKDVYQPAHRIDRGHLVRREDNCWGESKEETGYANADTFHWTNCTPQHELFNQEHPGKDPRYRGRVGAWGAFEQDMQEQIGEAGGKFTVFSGPVLRPELCKSYDFGTGKVLVPLRFWKVIVIPSTARGKLEAYGRLFDQSPSIEEFGVGEESRLQVPDRVPLSEIERLAGIKFPAVVLDADQASRSRM